MRHAEGGGQMRQFIALAAVSMAALAIANPAFGQAPAAAQGDNEAQADGDVPAAAIIVTGSRIARSDYTSASPIITTSETMLQNTGAINIEGALNQSPQFTPAQGATTNALRGGGRATLNLRGLGEQRNLVLLNGRRLPVSNELNVVDVNILPNIMIGNVEVITGGASAVYGSDAMSGVVNFKTRPNFEGLLIDAQYGASMEGDAGQYSISSVMGGEFSEGRGHATLSFGMSDRKEVKGSAREFYKFGVPSGNLGTGDARWTGNLPSQAAVNSVFAKYGFAAGTVARASNIGFNDDGTLFAVLGGINAKLSPDLYGLNGANLAQYTAAHNTIIVPQRRYNIFADMDYEITPGITAYMQGMYAHSFASMATGYTLTLPTVTVPVTNPFIPADLRVLIASRANPNAPIIFGKRFEQAPPRYIDQQFETFQILGGLRGNLGESFNWDIYASRDQTINNENLTVGFRQSRLQALLNAADGGASICAGGYNIFGNAPISAECLSYISTSVKSVTRVDQTIVEANVGGKLLRLPAGDLRVSVTATHRENGYDFSPDALLVPAGPRDTANDILATGSSRPTVGATTVNEIGIELLVPLLADTRFAESLNLSLGGRYSRQNVTGGVWTYKAELDWRPVSALLIRGGYERATRSPNIGELFSAFTRNASQLGFAPTAGDPCDISFVGRTAQIRQLCLDTGVPASVIDNFAFGSSAIGANVTGNIAVKPETADTFTIGAVLSPKFSSLLVRSLALSVDYYNINIKDAIGTIPGNTTVNKCYNLDGSNPTYSANNVFCQGIVRFSDSGLISDVFTPYLNVGGFRTSGIDVQLDSTVDLDAIGLSGRLALSSVINWLDKFEVQTLPGSPYQDFAGTIGTRALPRWRATSSLAYSNGPATIGVRWRHIGGMQHETVVTRPSSPALSTPSYDNFDINARVTVNEKLELRAGITNVFDTDPRVVGGVAGSTNAGLYDVVGRAFFVGARTTF
jgi:outer membrane receptor protein involved in Fe transport